MRSDYPFYFLPGIRQDLTSFFTQTYTSGTWCRFQYGMPRKMGGYKLTNGNYNSIPRGVFVATGSPYFGLYVGTSSNLYLILFTSNGDSVFLVNDITPAGFRVDINNLWSFTTMFDSSLGTNIIVAVCSPNLYSIDSSVETTVYYGPLLSTDPLLPTDYKCSGGVCTLGNQLFRFGENLSWTQDNLVNSVADTTEIGTGQKIIAGLQTRAGTNSPGGIFWTLDGVIRATSNGPDPADFAFDTLSNKNSILSSKSVVQWDSIYVWAGRTRFMLYDGIVKELKNEYNRNWFYENLNIQQRQKVWAEVVPAMGEIWWHFPFGNSIECNQAVIFNVRTGEWYNTASNRGAGHYNSVYGYPIWTGNTTYDGVNYGAWTHEYGYDQNINGILTPIQSNFKSGNLAYCAYAVDSAPQYGASGQRGNVYKHVDLYRLEPDFIQVGDLTMTVYTYDFARSNPVISAPYTIVDSINKQNYASGKYYEKIDLRHQGRIVQILFESNTIGGFYHMGRTLLSLGLGDTRQT